MCVRKRYKNRSQQIVLDLKEEERIGRKPTDSIRPKNRIGSKKRVKFIHTWYT